MRLRPNLPKDYAMKLSDSLVTVARKHQIDKYLIVAIYAQESGFNNQAKNCQMGLDSNNKKHKICFDYGIGQINYVTAKSYDMDLNRILMDTHYSVESSILILKDFKTRYQKSEPLNWWSRYNSSSAYWRGHYKTLVCRYYTGDKYCKKAHKDKKYQKMVDRIKEN
jgi:hypothetical protein